MQNDFTYLAILLGLFALMFGLVRACDRIIGSDEEALADDEGGPSDATARDEDEEVAA
jgi:hypothetical protein